MFLSALFQFKDTQQSRTLACILMMGCKCIILMKNLSLSISALGPSLQWCLTQSVQSALVPHQGRRRLSTHHNAPGWLNYWCLLMFFSSHWAHGSSPLCLLQALDANKGSEMSSVGLREREREKVFHGTPNTRTETKRGLFQMPADPSFLHVFRRQFSFS